jgi:hypothetical protein
MDCDAANILAPDFDLTGVETRPQRQSDLASRRAERQRATNRPAGSVERRKNAVAGPLHQIAAMLLDDLACKVVMTVEQLAPTLIAHRYSAFG